MTAPAPESAPPVLSNRESEILHALGDGRSNIEIGILLGIAEDTVKTHLRRLYKKLGAKDRAHAVGIGFRLDLISSPNLRQCAIDEDDWPHGAAPHGGIAVTVLPSACPAPEARLFTVIASPLDPDAPTAWTVHHLNRTLNNRGRWDDTPPEDDMDPTWRASHVFTAPEAQRRAENAAPGVVIGGITAAEATLTYRRTGRLR